MSNFNIKREDLGFIVARSLAIWIGCIAIANISLLLNTLNQMRGLGSSEDSFLRTVYVEQLIEEVVLMVFGLFVWYRAKSFAPRTASTEEAGESVTLGIADIRTTVIGCVGWWILINSMATLIGIFVKEFFVLQNSVKPMTAQLGWQSSAAQAVLAVLVILSCRFPDWRKKATEYLNPPPLD